MTAPGAQADVRLDAGLVEIRTRWSRRERSERILVPPQMHPDVALTGALRRSRLLRPGRNFRTRILLETPHVIHVEEPGAGRDVVTRCVLPAELQDRLLAAAAHRRVRGPATLGLGPLARADAACHEVGIGMQAPDEVGVIIDRSNAAVTILLLSVAGLLWARSVPSDDPAIAVALLAARARDVLARDRRILWWRLHDVASCEDAAAAGLLIHEVESTVASVFGAVQRFAE